MGMSSAFIFLPRLSVTVATPFGARETETRSHDAARDEAARNIAAATRKKCFVFVGIAF
jgi:hypothetical protein